MNKYVLMLAAAGLIAAAPAYYAFQAQANEGASPAAAEASAVPETTATPADEAAADAASEGEATDSADQAPAAGEPASEQAPAEGAAE